MPIPSTFPPLSANFPPLFPFSYRSCVRTRPIACSWHVAVFPPSLRCFAAPCFLHPPPSFHRPIHPSLPPLPPPLPSPPFPPPLPSLPHPFNFVSPLPSPSPPTPLHPLFTLTLTLLFSPAPDLPPNTPAYLAACSGVSNATLGKILPPRPS
ncbi:hypothetical protein C8J57DRAFT_1524261 [Mycena rebaudengoi]|nr:hypothetical protein C8J57DRAFT_1524261 [Mycena rebaudengoi]